MTEPRSSEEFLPSLTHPFYFIRNGLAAAIGKKAPLLTGRLLDFGCGSKPYKHYFSVVEYIGVDYENEGHPHQNESIDVFYDGKSLPFADEYFDSIFASEVFEHVFNLEEILAELNRVIKPGGNLLITCPFVWNEHEVPFDFARYTRFALQDRLEKNGFTILEYTKTGNFVTAIMQLWILYFNTITPGWVRRFVFFRVLYKACFFLLPNIVGVVLNKVLPENRTLYLNNVVLAQKAKGNIPGE